jgi:hypothetical protein
MIPTTTKPAPARAASFPGRETALALEPALTSADCDPTDVPGLAHALIALVGQVRVLLPDQPPVSLTVTPPELACLLTRLRPDRTAPAALRRILTERFTSQTALEWPWPAARPTWTGAGPGSRF